MDTGLAYSLAENVAFLAFLFGMFYWMITRTDKIATVVAMKADETGQAILAAFVKLAEELKTHQISDARMFGEITTAIRLTQPPLRVRKKAKKK